VLFGKYGAHLPLNRQSEIYTREGVELDVSTLVDWVGACAATLMPLRDAIEARVRAAERLHVDDTMVPVLAKNKCRIDPARCAASAGQISKVRAEPGSPLPARSFFPGGFRTPTLGAHRGARHGPASETRHKFRHIWRQRGERVEHFAFGCRGSAPCLTAKRSCSWSALQSVDRWDPSM
jgi:hypothetical protein